MSQRPIGLYQIESGDTTNATLEEKLSNILQETGLDSDGTYTPDSSTNYITAATSLKDADKKLDTAIKGVSDALGNHESDTSTHGVGEIVGTTETQTLTHKTIDADSNTISNIAVGNLKSGVLDTDLTSVAGTDTTIPSAKAVKSYVDNQIAGLASDLTYKGTFDASATDFAALADGIRGDFYKVAVAGTIDGVDYQVGDMIIVNKNVTGTPVTADIDKIDNTEAADLVRFVGGALKNGGSAITVDADKNTISNLETDNFKSGVISTDNTFASASDTVLATQKAIKEYIAAEVAAAIASARTHTITNHTATVNETAKDITVPAYVLGANNLMVFRNGVYLIPGSGEYTEKNTTTITVASIRKDAVITIVN
jgi:hypothetical protein